LQHAAISISVQNRNAQHGVATCAVYGSPVTVAVRRLLGDDAATGTRHRVAFVFGVTAAHSELLCALSGGRAHAGCGVSHDVAMLLQ